MQCSVKGDFKGTFIKKNPECHLWSTCLVSHGHVWSFVFSSHRRILHKNTEQNPKASGLGQKPSHQFQSLNKEVIFMPPNVVSMKSESQFRFNVLVNLFTWLSSKRSEPLTPCRQLALLSQSRWKVPEDSSTRTFSDKWWENNPPDGEIYISSMVSHVIETKLCQLYILLQRQHNISDRRVLFELKGQSQMH